MIYLEFTPRYGIFLTGKLMFKILKAWDSRGIPFLDKPTCLIADAAAVAVDNSPGRKCNEQSSVAASYIASA